MDELPDDVVSTDRRSINWDDDATLALHEWGAKKVLEWIEKYRTWKKNKPKQEIIDLIRTIPSATGLSAPEEEALTELLSEVFITLGNNDDAKLNIATNFASAWTHEPTRKLTQSLWKEVVNKTGNSAEIMSGLIERLRESMVPEAMSVAVTVAQRIGAITSLMHLIDKGSTETKLQHLIEQFPWILGPEWELLCANRTIRKLVEDKFPSHFEMPVSQETMLVQNKRPDFVFLSDVAERSEHVVFELKGPECEKTLRIDEYRQLSSYLDTIYDARPTVPIKGVLIGHDKGGFAETDTRIVVMRWDEIFMAARSSHLSFLLSLLTVSSPARDDQRMKQIADFGGKETIELLQKFASFSDLGKDVLQALPPVSN